MESANAQHGRCMLSTVHECPSLEVAAAVTAESGSTHSYVMCHMLQW